MYEPTPTNKKHIDGYLKKLPIVKGLSLNSNLYSNDEGNNASERM